MKLKVFKKDYDGRKDEVSITLLGQTKAFEFFEPGKVYEFSRVSDLPDIPKESALDVQVGGGHYKDLVIQPIEYTHKNNLNFCQGNIIKYTTRYKDKNGIEDLKKVKHYIDLLIELEYGKQACNPKETE